MFGGRLLASDRIVPFVPEFHNSCDSTACSRTPVPRRPRNSIINHQTANITTGTITAQTPVPTEVENLNAAFVFPCEDPVSVPVSALSVPVIVVVVPVVVSIVSGGAWPGADAVGSGNAVSVGALESVGFGAGGWGWDVGELGEVEIGVTVVDSVDGGSGGGSGLEVFGSLTGGSSDEDGLVMVNSGEMLPELPITENAYVSAFDGGRGGAKDIRAIMYEFRVGTSGTVIGTCPAVIGKPCARGLSVR